MSAVHVPRGSGQDTLAPALVGVSILESLGTPLAHAGRDDMFAFSSVSLQQCPAGIISIHPTGTGETDGEETPTRLETMLGRQRVLWEAVPQLRTATDDTKHIRACCCLPLARATAVTGPGSA